MWCYGPSGVHHEWRPVQKRPKPPVPQPVDCFPTCYSDPTPSGYDSFGLNAECEVKPTEELQGRRAQILYEVVPRIPTLWEKKNLIKPKEVKVPRTIVSLDVEDPHHHEGACQTRTESQRLGWFADPKRLPPCKMREWKKDHSFVN